MRIRAIRMTAMKTWSALRKACTRASLAIERVDLAQDLDRIRSQGTVGFAPVLLRELAHAEVQLGVADVAVLRLLRGLERRAPVLDHPLLLAGPTKRTGHHEHDDRHEQHRRERELHQSA